MVVPVAQAHPVLSVAGMTLGRVDLRDSSILVRLASGAVTGPSSGR